MNNIELINIEPFNPLISKCQIKVCWVGETPNRNGSIITKEVGKQLANSLPGSPIVGHYNETTGDFEEHNKIIEVTEGKVSLIPDTRPYGFVPPDAKVWFQWFEDADGISREYLVTEGLLWTGQYPECQRIISQGNNHSMELCEDEKFFDGAWAESLNLQGRFFIINEAIISKLCILGEEYEPCFEGANITAPKIQFSLDDEFKEQVFTMMTEIKNILNEGGASMDDIEFKNEEQEPKVELCPDCGKPLAECECKKDEYVLEEIPEYTELQTRFAALEMQFNELTSAHEVLKAEYQALVEFKALADRKEKEALIDTFYMLTDEMKKEVVDKIDEYSLEDIEAKLSILCVRNKVSFDLKQDEDPLSYSLHSEDNEDTTLPEWVKAVKAINE